MAGFIIPPVFFAERRFIRMKKRLQLILLLLPFFNPTSLQYIPVTATLYSFIQVWKLISILIIIILYSLRRRFSAIICMIITFEILLMITSAVNGVVENRVFTNALLAIGISMLSERYIKKDACLYMKTLSDITYILIIINFIFCILYPGGMKMAILYRNWNNPMYFLGIDNGMIKELLPGVSFSYILAFCLDTSGKDGKRFWIISAVSLATLIVVKSATGLVTFMIYEILLASYSMIIKNKIPYKVLISVYLFFMLAVVVLGNSLSVIENITFLLGRSTTFTGRVTLWRQAIISFSKSPLTGHGYTSGSIEVWGGNYSSHNMILEILLQGGIACLIPFAASTVYALLQNLHAKYLYHNIIFLSIFSFLIVGLMEAGINYMFFIFLVLACYPDYKPVSGMKIIKI